MKLFGRSVKHAAASAAEHGVSAKYNTINDVRDMAIEMAFRQPNHSFGITDLKPGTVLHGLSNTWDFTSSEFRADDPHVSQLVLALKCLIDTDMVWVRMRIDNGGQPDPFFSTVRQNGFGFRSIDCGGRPSLRAHSNPDEVVLGRRYLMHLQRTACAEKWCGGSANNVWHSSGTVLPWMRVVRMYL